MINIKTLILCSFSFSAYAQINEWIKKAEDTYDKNKSKVEQTIDQYISGKTHSLTDSEVIQGLKEALSVGTQSAVNISGREDGYFKNPKIFIPFPPEAKEMKDKLIQYGFSKKVNEFELALNRAAENAAQQAKPIFIHSIEQMTINDAMSILKGTDTSATYYLKKTTYDSLYQNFLPVVKKSIQQVKLTNYWKPLITTYNKLPNSKKYNPDLDRYVTEMAIRGPFVLIADEEKNIRKNPSARISDILKKIFAN